MDKLDKAQAELEHQQRQQIVDWCLENGRARQVTYAVEDEDGNPLGVTEVVTGACFVDEAAPDRSAEN